MKRITLIIAAGLLSLGLPRQTHRTMPLQLMAELLRLIEQGQARDSQEARQREAAFAQARNQQQSLLNQARAERTRQENDSSQLENQFEDNQQRIITARQALDERLGALKELFGVLQTVRGDTQGRFAASLTNIQYPDRSEFLVELGSKMAGASRLASIEDIERLWSCCSRKSSSRARYALQPLVTRPMATRKKWKLSVLARSTSSRQRLPRVQRRRHDFGAAASAGWQVPRYDRRHDGRRAGRAVAFGVDVTRGGILALLVESPTIKDRIEQGGIVGYCIIALGIIGLLIAIMRWLGLSTADRKVTAQLKRDTASTDNPLGRVLAAYESNRGADTETIELKLVEAALKEMPGLTKGLLFIKVVSAVAPLMGLLGTVTGMIKTFQVITLYGAGDPKMMAGGISQALMTTVLGLVVAIPMVLLHTVVSGKSRKIVNILQSQSAGLVAQHSEKSH